MNGTVENEKELSQGDLPLAALQPDAAPGAFDQKLRIALHALALLCIVALLIWCCFFAPRQLDDQADAALLLEDMGRRSCIA